MVDNRPLGPISNIGFKSDNAMANKMSDEKQGQGGEYFAQEVLDDDEANQNQNNFQDRSAQLRASLNGLAMANAGSIMFMKTLKKKEFEKKLKEKFETDSDEESKDKQEVLDE